MKGFESLEKADLGTIFGNTPGEGRAAAETKLLSARQKVSATSSVVLALVS